MEKFFFTAWLLGSVVLGVEAGKAPPRPTRAALAQTPAPEPTMQTPATILAAFISISAGAFGTVCWALRAKFKENEDQRIKIDKLADAVKDLIKANELQNASLVAEFKSSSSSIKENCAAARMLMRARHDAEEGGK